MFHSRPDTELQEHMYCIFHFSLFDIYQITTKLNHLQLPMVIYTLVIVKQVLSEEDTLRYAANV